MTSLSHTEKHIRSILKFAEVKIDILRNGKYDVAVFPRNSGMLWWSASDDALQTALEKCIAKAIELKFMEQ